jgi:hypothetical protein
MAPPGTKYEFLHEIAPGRAASGETPASSPVYVSAYAKGGIELLPGIETCYDIWRCAALRLMVAVVLLGWREGGSVCCTLLTRLLVCEQRAPSHNNPFLTHAPHSNHPRRTNNKRQLGRGAVPDARRARVAARARRRKVWPLRGL